MLRYSSGELSRENACARPSVQTERGSPPGCDFLSKIVSKWLLPCHVCCGRATVGEHLASAAGGPGSRRFLATPLHEMMFHRRLATVPANRTGTFSGFRHLTEGGCGSRFPMDAKTNIKNRLPSRHVTEGPERAPHRSYLYAMGLTTEQIHQPFVGVASCWNEAAPCNIALMRQAQAVKKGVAHAGGTPREFCTITVTDGIAMGHDGMKSSLASREVIADSVELTIRGHAYDALVGLAGCDKSLPGMMMAMVRLNVPSIFIYGGSILPGNFRGQQVTVQDMFEAVGKHSVGEMSDDDLDEIERVACPSAGACGAQFTANTMATVSEAIGLALPYSAGAPAPYEIRDSFCMTAGERVMDLIRSNIRPRDIVTRKSLENAAAVVAASGGSTNAGLHLPAIANEAGIKFDLFDVAEIFKKTPYIADLKPGGRYVAKDMFEAGGIPLLMKTLLDHGFLHGDCLTVTGRTIAENLKSVKWNPHQDVV